MRQSELAELLEVSQSRLSNWERGQHDPPPDVLTRISRLLGVSIDFFYEDESDSKAVLSKSQTFVYNTADDSEPSLEAINAVKAIADTRTVSKSVIHWGGPGPWSAKGAQRETVSVFAFIGEKPLVKIPDEALRHQFVRGTIIAFMEDDYPYEDVYLLVSRRDAPDILAILVIDSSKGSSMLVDIDTGATYPLRDWNVLGFAWAEIKGGKSGSTDMNIKTSGIGPKR